MNSTKEMITKKPADFYNRSNGNRIECELRGVGTCSVVKTVYKVRRSSWLNQASSLVIRLILISLAGVRLQSKQDSHCESCFVFGLTPVWSFEGVRPRLTPVPRNSDYKENPQGFRESSFFTKKSIPLLYNVSAHPSKAPTNSYSCSNRISFIFVRFGLE